MLLFSSPGTVFFFKLNVKMKISKDRSFRNIASQIGAVFHCYFFYFYFSFLCSSSVELTARLESPRGGTAEHVDVWLWPGQDVAGLRSAVAGCQVVDLARRQLLVPHIEIRQLAYESLRSVKSATQRVLAGRNEKKKSLWANRVAGGRSC